MKRARRAFTENGNGIVRRLREVFGQGGSRQAGGMAGASRAGIIRVDEKFTEELNWS